MSTSFALERVTVAVALTLILIFGVLFAMRLADVERRLSDAERDLSGVERRVGNAEHRLSETERHPRALDKKDPIGFLHFSPA